MLIQQAQMEMDAQKAAIANDVQNVQRAGAINAVGPLNGLPGLQGVPPGAGAGPQPGPGGIKPVGQMPPPVQAPQTPGGLVGLQGQGQMMGQGGPPQAPQLPQRQQQMPPMAQGGVPGGQPPPQGGPPMAGGAPPQQQPSGPEKFFADRQQFMDLVYSDVAKRLGPKASPERIHFAVQDAMKTALPAFEAQQKQQMGLDQKAEQFRQTMQFKYFGKQQAENDFQQKQANYLTVSNNRNSTAKEISDARNAVSMARARMQAATSEYNTNARVGAQYYGIDMSAYRAELGSADKEYGIEQGAANTDVRANAQAPSSRQVPVPKINAPAKPPRPTRGSFDKPKVTAPVTGRTYSSPDQVAAAHKAGKLTRDEAAKILNEQFGIK